jgi:energy-converting hydrogenase Eha subunit B
MLDFDILKIIINDIISWIGQLLIDSAEACPVARLLEKLGALSRKIAG